MPADVISRFVKVFATVAIAAVLPCMMYELFDAPFDIRPDGTVHAPEKPGLGFTLRKDALERFRYVEGPEYRF